MFHNNIVKISEILNKRNLLKTSSRLPTLPIFAYFAAILTVRKMKIFDFKTNEQNQTFCVYIDTTNGFTLYHNKSLQINVFFVKRPAKTTFCKMLEGQWYMYRFQNRYYSKREEFTQGLLLKGRICSSLGANSSL